TFDSEYSLDAALSPSELGLAFLRDSAALTGEVRTVAGVDCQLWTASVAHVEVCERLGVVLEATAQVLGAEERVTAIRVDFETPVSDAVFATPPGVRFKAKDTAPAVDPAGRARAEAFSGAKLDPNVPEELQRLREAAAAIMEQ